MIELPVCRWRGELNEHGRYPCSSSKLLTTPQGVSPETCLKCYCADHEPVEVKAEEPVAPRPRPTFAERAGRFVLAMRDEIAWRASGGAGPTDEEKAFRRAACDDCEHLDREHDGCSVCGCYLEAGFIPPRPYGKLDCSTQLCPAGKWSYTGGYSPPPQGRKCCGGGK